MAYRVHTLVLLAALAAGGALVDATPAAAVCSVFDRHPCPSTNCSVFQRRPCIPEIEYPIGQDLRLTIESAGAADVAAARHAPSDAAQDAAQGDKLDTINALFDALRNCWVPPPREEIQAGMQMSVRLSFKRNGEIIGMPRVTYTSPGTPGEARERYHRAITEALERCTPMQFTAGLGGAVAGRPIAIRFVDNREKLRNEAQP
jgi:hypothetical protein